MAFNSTKLNNAIRDLTNWVRTGVGKKADKTYVDGLVAEGVKSTTDTETTEIIGSGRPDSPLTINVKLDPRVNNRLRIYGGGGLGVFDEAPPDVQTQYINTAVGQDSNPGTRAMPLKTIERAFERIVNSGGVGSFSVRLKAGQTFVTGGRPINMDNALITITPYDDPKYLDGSDTTAGPEYYYWAAPDYSRPILRFANVQDAQFPQYRIHSVYYAKAWVISGIRLELPSQPANFPGYPWYSLSTENSGGRLWMTGNDIVFGHAGSQAVGRVSTMWMQTNNLLNFGGGNTLGSDVTMFSIGADEAHNRHFVPLDPKYPAFTGRTSNTKAVLTPANLNIGSSYNATTKTLFGTNVNYDIFAGS